MATNTIIMSIAQVITNHRTYKLHLSNIFGQIKSNYLKYHDNQRNNNHNIPMLLSNHITYPLHLSKIIN